MVLELWLRPHQAEREPWKVMIIAFLVTLLGYAFSYYIFPDNYSLASVLITSSILTPFFTGLFIAEEKDEERKKSHLKEVMEVFWLFFLGVMFGYIFIYALPFPKPEYQILEVSRIVGRATNFGLMGEILSNNLRVLLLTYLLSFMFGATSIFILVWNASILGTWVGEVFMKPSPTILQGIVSAFLGLLSISAHGILEFSAYFFAAVGGGILSVGIMRKKTHHLLEQSVKMFAVSIILMIAAAFIEAL